MSDLISRRAVINEIERWIGYIDGDMIARINIGINKLPSADRPRGYWIGDKCSVCGEERAWYGSNPPICPDCGADMRERSEE